MLKMVEEQWVIWRYSKQIVQQPSFPGRSALPGYHFKSADSFPSSSPPYFPGVETEGPEVQSLARGQSRPAGGPRLCSAPGVRAAGSRTQWTLPKGRGLSALLAVRTEPCQPPATTSADSGQRAAIRRAGAEIQPLQETAPSRRPQPQTPT